MPKQVVYCGLTNAIRLCPLEGQISHIDMMSIRRMARTVIQIPCPEFRLPGSTRYPATADNSDSECPTQLGETVFRWHDMSTTRKLGSTTALRRRGHGYCPRHYGVGRKPLSKALHTPFYGNISPHMSHTISYPRSAYQSLWTYSNGSAFAGTRTRNALLSDSRQRQFPISLRLKMDPFIHNKLVHTYTTLYAICGRGSNIAGV